MKRIRRSVSIEVTVNYDREISESNEHCVRRSPLSGEKTVEIEFINFGQEVTWSEFEEECSRLNVRPANFFERKALLEDCTQRLAFHESLQFGQRHRIPLQLLPASLPSRITIWFLESFIVNVMKDADTNEEVWSETAFSGLYRNGNNFEEFFDELWDGFSSDCWFAVVVR